MKKILATLLCFTSCATSAPLEKGPDVPTAVKRSFDKTFPGAGHLSWMQEGADYEASFSQKGTASTATFNASGALKQMEKDIPNYALPNAALRYLKEHYALFAFGAAGVAFAAEKWRKRQHR